MWHDDLNQYNRDGDADLKAEFLAAGDTQEIPMQVLTCSHCRCRFAYPADAFTRFCSLVCGEASYAEGCVDGIVEPDHIVTGTDEIPF